MIPVQVHVPQVSRRSRALAARLTKAINDFRHEEPKISDEEIHTAILLARPGHSFDRRRRIAIAAILIGVFVALSVGIVASADERGGIQVNTLLWPVLALLAVCCVAGIMALIRLRDR